MATSAWISPSLQEQRCRDEVLRTAVIPFMRQHPALHLFQQDNARPHTARIAQAYLQRNRSRHFHGHLSVPICLPLNMPGMNWGDVCTTNSHSLLWSQSYRLHLLRSGEGCHSTRFSSLYSRCGGETWPVLLLGEVIHDTEQCTEIGLVLIGSTYI